MSPNHWKDLIVWEKAHRLTRDIYSVTYYFPESEKYNLISQIRRASTSIVTNIVGHDRSSTNDFLQFLYISRGSLEEVRYLILLAKELKFVDDKKYQVIEKIVPNLVYSLKN